MFLSSVCFLHFSDCFCQVFAQFSSCPPPPLRPPPSQNKSEKFSQRALLCRIFIKLRSTWSPSVPLLYNQHHPLCRRPTIATVLNETVHSSSVRFELSPHPPRFCITSLEQRGECAIQRIHGSQRISLTITSKHIQPLWSSLVPLSSPWCNCNPSFLLELTTIYGFRFSQRGSENMCFH